MRDLKSCRVLVTPTTYGKSDPRLRAELEAAVGEVIYNPVARPLTSAELWDVLPGIDGYIAGLDTIDRAALERADRLKVIARYGVGVDKVDLTAAHERSIVVANTPEANSVSVAELTIALMLSLARSVLQNANEVRGGRWPRTRGLTLRGKTVGLLGFGSIGKEVARRLQTWDCRIIAYDPFPNEDAARSLGVELRTLEDVLAQSDFLSLHVPVLPETRHMVDADFLARVKRGSYLINTARGELVDEGALAEAVRTGRLSGAALDVYAEEPPPCGHPCLELPQIITTPHCASHTDDAMDAMGWGALRACLAVLSGDQPEHRVFPKTPNPPYKISKKTVPTMYFIGVDTTRSSIMKVFPLWMREMARPEVVLEGMNFKLHDDPERYRAAVAQIKYDPLSLGALVTSHKITLFEAARDMFDYVDPYAVTCGEVSSISKNGSALEGHAKDPISAGLSLDSLLGKNYFHLNGGHVLCFGAGGSTTAIILYFAHKPNRRDRPERVVVVNRSPGRLEHLKAMIAGLNTDIQFEYHCNNDPEINDSYMAKVPPASLVINATGMGKDLPGSPITGRGLFPERGVAWELNYRGELGFLHQALAQAESRRLTVEDGWLYFLHGWTQVIAQVLKVNIDDRMLKRLAEVAGRVCTPALSQRVVGGLVSEPASQA